MKYRSIITLAGKPGSGKSSTGNLLAEELGYERFSSGDFMRSIAKDRGITLAELGKIAEKDETIDHEVDAMNRQAGKKENIVIDSRLAFHWIPDSFKVYLDVDSQIAAERILKDMTGARKESGEDYQTPEELAESMDQRRESANKRYEMYYRVNPGKPEHYDLVIDTATLPLEGVVAKILEEYRKIEKA